MDLQTEKWVVYEESKETSEKESYREEEFEEDENTTDEQRKEQMFQKWKCQPGCSSSGGYNDRSSYDRNGNRDKRGGM